MSTRTKEEIQEIWTATNTPHTKSNRPPRLTKKEKKLIGVGKDEGRATLKYARISSRKIKIVADLIKGKNAIEAMNLLKFTPKAGSSILAKLLKSAMSNAENNNNLSKIFAAVDKNNELINSDSLIYFFECEDEETAKNLITKNKI